MSPVQTNTETTLWPVAGGDKHLLTQVSYKHKDQEQPQLENESESYFFMWEGAFGKTHWMNDVLRKREKAMLSAKLNKKEAHGGPCTPVILWPAQPSLNPELDSK